MYARVKELLTPEERLRYTQIPSDLGEWELGTYFTLAQHDIEVIRRRRRDYNRLGFAVQLCVLRYLGWPLSDVNDIPEKILRYIAKQLNVNFKEFSSYSQREATKYEHLDEIRKEYGYSSFTIHEYRTLSKFLYPQAMLNGNPLHLIQVALEELPYIALEAVLPWDRLVASVEEAKQLARPVDYDYLDLLEKKFYVLRKYTPTLLTSLEFHSTKSAEPLMRAIEMVRTMNANGKRKVPEDAPLEFISNRWQKHIYDDDGNINRHYYEMAVLTELRNSIRSGDVSIAGSREHKDFEEYLFSKED